MAAYDVTVTVYDTDNITLLEGAKVLISDATVRGTTAASSTTAIKLTNASGVATFDLDAEIDDFAVGDHIQIIVYKGSSATHSQDSGYDNHTTASGDSGAYAPTIYMNSGIAMVDVNTRIMELSVSNEAGDVGDVSLYDRSDTLKFKARIPANNNSHFLWRRGLPFSGGVVIIRSAQTLVTTVNVK